METSTDLFSLLWAIELTALFLVAVICFLIYSVRQNTNALKRIGDKITQGVKDKRDSDFFDSEQAEKWVEKGETKQLTQYCESFMKEIPNSVQANWYYALSRYNDGDYEIAREYFEKVIRINPLWRDGAIVYLQEIADKIGMPTAQTLH